LDSDYDGKISAYRIDIKQLDSKVLDIITPLFVEMEELEMVLDEEEFIDAASRLYDTLTLPEKDILIGRRQKSRSNSLRGGQANLDKKF
jgi:hypothetical protein